MLRISFRKFSELEDIFSKSVHNLKKSNKPLPRRESLLLYRQVLKFSKEFHWLNERGDNWGDKIRQSARNEFELARFEKDPFLIGQMIVTSKDAMTKIREKLIKKYAETNNQLLTGNFVFKEDRTDYQRRQNDEDKEDKRGFVSDTYKD